MLMADANGKELEQWGIVKSQIPSTKSQGVRCQVSGISEEKQKS
jgi:hypothetical protein